MLGYDRVAVLPCAGGVWLAVGVGIQKKEEGNTNQIPNARKGGVDEDERRACALVLLVRGVLEGVFWSWFEAFFMVRGSLKRDFPYQLAIPLCITLSLVRETH